VRKAGRVSSRTASSRNRAQNRRHLANVFTRLSHRFDLRYVDPGPLLGRKRHFNLVYMLHVLLQQARDGPIGI
jgi:hypothetical protein